jgi:hypothetical protein
MNLNKLETLLGIKRKNESMIEELKKKNHFTTFRSEIALDTFSRYVDYLQKHGINWIVLKLLSPILWHSLEDNENE